MWYTIPIKMQKIGSSTTLIAGIRHGSEKEDLVGKWWIMYYSIMEK